MNTVISVAKNQIKNQIQKTLDVSISFGIPIIALVYLFIFWEVSKFMVFQVAIFSMLLCFWGCWYVMRLFLEKQLAVNQIILQVVKK